MPSRKPKVKNLFFLLQLIFTVLCLIITIELSAQPPQIKEILSPHEKLKAGLENYIKEFSDEAIAQMIEFKIPASVVLAQAIFESASGNSELAKKSNNHFGIKCHFEWAGDTITKDDDTLNECFRKYERVSDSYHDHSLFLLNRPRYSSLFSFASNDFMSWCYGLKSTGYATYPTYAEDLIKLIEEQQLYELDNVLDLKTECVKSKIRKFEESEINISEMYITNTQIQDLYKSGIVWLDEKDVALESLDMIIDSGIEENAVVGNP